MRSRPQHSSDCTATSAPYLATAEPLPIPPVPADWLHSISLILMEQQTAAQVQLVGFTNTAHGIP